MSRLHELGLQHGTDKATYHGYCDFYEEHLPPEIDRLLEIGVMDGASLRMWRDFYPDAQIIGVDIERRQPVEGCTVIRGDATRRPFLHSVYAKVGPFDVIVDDGSHLTSHQQATFSMLYGPALKDGGLYIIEDLHTSFWPNYVDSEQSTYAWLFTSGLDVTFWSRTDDRMESVTSVIRKPA